MIGFDLSIPDRALLGRARGASSPTAPVVTYVSESAGNAYFTYDLDAAIVAGDLLRREASTSSSDFTSPVYDDGAGGYTLTSGDLSGGTLGTQVHFSSNGTYYLRAAVQHGGVWSAWSSVTPSFNITTAYTYTPTFYYLGF